MMKSITAVYLRLTSQLLGLSTPIAMMLVIDKVVGSGGENTLLVLVAGVALLTFFQYLFVAASALHDAREIELRAHASRSRVFGALAAWPDAAGWASAGWDIIQNCADAELHRVETRAQFQADCLYVALLAVLMCAFSPLLLAISAAFVPLYIGVVAFSAQLARRHAAPLGAERSELSGRYFEAVGATATLRALDLAPYLTGRWRELDARSALARWRLAVVQRLSAHAVELLQKVSLLVIMLLGVASVLAGAMTLGQYIAFNLLSMQLGAPVLRLAAFRRAAIDQTVREQSHRTLLEASEQPPWPPSGDRPFPLHDPILVTARELLVGSAGSAARAISFALRSGSWLGITGPSGCGKSTLLSQLAGLRSPASGAVAVNGQALEQFERSALTRSLRLVPQQPVLFVGSIADNIRLGDLGATPQQIVTAAHLCGLGAVLAGLPHHLDTRIGAGGHALSSGELQRIAIARAIVSRPRVLLLDEATAVLDAISERLLLTNLRRFLPETAVVVVSHRVASLSCCEQVLDLAPAPVALAR
jgi:ATP-binding cassette, subfamily B, bacterial HlyB/CyaB